MPSKRENGPAHREKPHGLAALEEIRALRVQPPVREGDTLLENVAGTGVALVATKTVQ